MCGHKRMRILIQITLKNVLYLFVSQLWLPALLAVVGGKVEKCTPGGYDLEGIVTQEETYEDTDVCI